MRRHAYGTNCMQCRRFCMQSLQICIDVKSVLILASVLQIMEWEVCELKEENAIC